MPWFKKRSETSARVATDSSPNGVYSGLRHQALSTKRSEVGIAAPTTDAPVWGTLMETGYDSVTVTLVALSDGSTSLYFSNGGGLIGGHSHEDVRLANSAFINQANHSLPDLKRCEVRGWCNDKGKNLQMLFRCRGIASDTEATNPRVVS